MQRPYFFNQTQPLFVLNICKTDFGHIMLALRYIQLIISRNALRLYNVQSNLLIL